MYGQQIPSKEAPRTHESERVKSNFAVESPAC